MAEKGHKTPPPAFTDHQPPTHTPTSVQGQPPYSPGPQYHDPTQNGTIANPQYPSNVYQEKYIGDPVRTQSDRAPERVATQSQPRHSPNSSREYLTATPIRSLTNHAAPVDCPMCGKRAMTRTTAKSGNFTQYVPRCFILRGGRILMKGSLWGVLTCAFLCLGCIPYFISSLKDVKHNCSNCGALLVIWHRSGGGVDVLAHPMK